MPNSNFRMELMCPHCYQKQIYIPREKTAAQRFHTGADFMGKKRRCIKCARMFDVAKNVVKHNTGYLQNTVQNRKRE